MVGSPNEKGGTAAGAAEAAEDFENENGRAAIGGSLALLESCNTGAFCMHFISTFVLDVTRLLTSGAKVNPLGLSKRVGIFLGSSKASLPSSPMLSSTSSSSNTAENRFFDFVTGRAIWFRLIRVRPTRKDDCSRPPEGRAEETGAVGSKVSAVSTGRASVTLSTISSWSVSIALARSFSSSSRSSSLRRASIFFMPPRPAYGLEVTVAFSSFFLPFFSDIPKRGFRSRSRSARIRTGACDFFGLNMSGIV